MIFTRWVCTRRPFSMLNSSSACKQMGMTRPVTGHCSRNHKTDWQTGFNYLSVNFLNFLFGLLLNEGHHVLDLKRQTQNTFFKFRCLPKVNKKKSNSQFLNIFLLNLYFINGKALHDSVNGYKNINVTDEVKVNLLSTVKVALFQLPMRDNGTLA